MRTIKNQTIQELVTLGYVSLEDVVVFTESKVPRPHVTLKSVDDFKIHKNLGLSARPDNDIFILDVDHLSDEGLSIFEDGVSKCFDGAKGTGAYNPKKYKHVFKVSGDKSKLTEYGQALNYGKPYGDRDVELFGVSKKAQSCKLAGTYGKKVSDCTEEDAEKIERKFQYSKVLHCFFKEEYGYRGKVDLILCTVTELCSFFDSLLARGFVKWSGVEKKTPTKGRGRPTKRKKLLDEIRCAPGGTSNDVYLKNCFQYIKECRNAGVHENECISDMESVLHERGISEKVENFKEHVREIYEREEQTTNGGKFEHHVMAREMIDDLNIVRFEKNIYFFDGNRYVSELDTLKGWMIKLKPGITIRQCKEVLHNLKCSFEVPIREHAPDNLIGFENGILDIETGEIKENSPEFFIQNIIPHKYDPDAYDEGLDKFLNDWACNDKDIRALLEECAGYLLYRSCSLKKCFFMYGEKNNGKSTFIELLQNMLGLENIATLDIKDLSDERNRAQILGKLANISDDVSGAFNPDASTFKKLVSGDFIDGRRIYESRFTFKPYAKLVFSGNEYPKMKDPTGAVKDRLIIIPFNASFPATGKNTEVREHMQTEEACEYMIKLAVSALKDRLLKNKAFTASAVVDAENKKYEKENNPILMWLDAYSEEKQVTEIEALKRESVPDLRMMYSAWCLFNGYNPVASNQFSKQISCHYPLVSTPVRMGDKTIRFFKDKQ